MALARSSAKVALIVIVLVALLAVPLASSGTVARAAPLPSGASPAAPAFGPHSSSAAPQFDLGHAATTLASAPSTAAASPSTESVSLPSVTLARQLIAEGKLNPSSVFFPNTNRPTHLSTSGTLSPSYPGTPAPMGLSDLGLGSGGGYVYNTSSFESVMTLNSFNDYNPGYAGWDAPPNYMTFQLNTVTVNTSYPGFTNGSFWIQNVVHFNGSSLQFENNIWNFSSPAAALNAGTLLNYTGTLVPGSFYYVYGPTYQVSYPFTLTLYNNLTGQGGHPGVYFNYTITNTSGSVSGSYDYVTWNGTYNPSSPIQFQVNGQHYNPLGYLFYDAEIIFGGNGGGANAVLTELNGTANLNYWNSATNSYASVPSAYDYGEDTGETSIGVSAYYVGTTEYLNQGPSLQYGLWNTSATSFGAAANPGWIHVAVSQPADYGFTFVSNSTTFATGVNASYAPSDNSGLTTVDLPPPALGTTYVFQTFANGYDSAFANFSANGSAALAPTANAAVVNTPVYLSTDAQAAAFGGAGIAGVSYNATSDWLWINGTVSALALPFRAVNDFFFPTFMLFAELNLSTSVGVNHLTQDPSTYNSTRFQQIWNLPAWNTGYYFNYGTGTFDLTNVTVQGDSVAYYTYDAYPIQAGEFWQTDGSSAWNIVTAQDSFGMDVLGSVDTDLWNIQGETGANGIAILESEFVTAENITSNGTDIAGFPTWAAYIDEAAFLELVNVTTTNGALGIEAFDVGYWDVDGLTDLNGEIGGVLEEVGFLSIEDLTVNDSEGLFLAEAEYVTIEGVTLTSDAFGGVIEDGLDLGIADLTVTNSTGFEIGYWTDFVTNDSTASGPLSSAYALLFEVVNVTVTNLTATNGAYGGSFEFVENVSVAWVNAWYGSGGLQLVGADNVTETDIVAVDNSIGVITADATDVSIANVVATDSSWGVGVEFDLDTFVADVNATSSSLEGLYFANDLGPAFPNAAVASIDNDEVLVLGVSALSSGYGVMDNDSSNVTIAELTEWNGIYGVSFNGSVNIELAESFLYGNEVGAWLYNTTNATVAADTIEGSAGYGISIDFGANAVVYADNFVANNGASTSGGYSASHIQASVSGISTVYFDYTGIGNYWSDWSGTGTYVIATGVADNAPDAQFITNWLKFVEVGLPTGLAWGFTLDTVPYTSTAPLVFIPSWTLPTATLGFTVQPPAGWVPTPASGTVDYTGTNQTVTISFVEVFYAVTFMATGLPDGTSWSVTFGGTTLSNTSASGTVSNVFEVPNGTYAYSIATVAGYLPSGPVSGSITISGSGVTKTLGYTQATYSVEFLESGLASGTAWSVTLNGVPESSATSSIVFTEPNGTYGFTVGTVSGYLAPTPGSGNATVAGFGQTVPISFTAAPPTYYNVTFSETGLTSGTSWSVTLNGTPMSSTTSTIVFSELNGSYIYTIPSVSGLVAAPNAGTEVVNGANLLVNVTFAAAPPSTYSVTFTESGLASGTQWTVMFDGKPESSTTSTIVFTEVANGSYTFTVGAVTGYTASPSSGPITVAGSSPGQTITFSKTSGPSSSSSSGLPSWAWIVIAVVILLVIVGVVVAVMMRGRKPPTSSGNEPSGESTGTEPPSQEWSEGQGPGGQ